MTTEQTKVYIKHFRHFSERLSLRFDILITYERYIELCGKPIEVLETQKTEKGMISLVGYLFVNGIKVKVVKEPSIIGTPLTTALPVPVFKKSDYLAEQQKKAKEQ